MTRHLTSQQFSEALLGGTMPEHLRECPACKAELVNMQNVLAHFRNSAHSWSENQIAAAQSRPNQTSSLALRICWALSVALLAMLGLHYSQEPPEPPDTVLLERINTAVTRTVPGQLEPLMVPTYR